MLLQQNGRARARSARARARAQLHSVARLHILSSPSAAEHSMALRCTLQHNLHAQARQYVSGEQRSTCQQHYNVTGSNPALASSLDMVALPVPMLNQVTKHY